MRIVRGVTFAASNLRASLSASSRMSTCCSPSSKIEEHMPASLADRAAQLVECRLYQLFCRGGDCPVNYQPCGVDDEVRLRQLDVMFAAGCKHLWRRRH